MRRGTKQLLLYLLCAIVVSVGIGLLLETANVSAASRQQVGQSPVHPSVNLADTPPIVSNDVCLECHGKPGLTMTLENGDILDLYVNPDIYYVSIHGNSGYACVQCHTNLGEYPHPSFTATDMRDVTLQLTGSCYRCHSGEATLTMDSVHAVAQAEGMREAAVCTDCHGSHYIHRWTDPVTDEILPGARLEIPITCSRCHSTIYQKYRGSVHGAALTDELNKDVPTCIDCHGVHNIEDPTTTQFRLNSPQLCASCHTDPTLMDHYGISTDVLDTYVSDFHGTTVTLFEKQSPDAPTNKPVCYDCHGVHEISKVDDPDTGLLMRENLLVRCKECHPDATSNFPSAWMSHFIPSPENYPLVYYVELFYRFFIPLVLGSMIALVGLNVGHSVYAKSRRRILPSHPHAPQPAPTPAPLDEPAQSVDDVPLESSQPAEDIPSDSPHAKEERPSTTETPPQSEHDNEEEHDE